MKPEFLIILLFLLAVNTFCYAAEAVDTELEVMIGQMIMVGFRGFELDSESKIISQIRDYHLGGVILFDYDVQLGIPERNIKNPEQVFALVSELRKASKIPLFVAIDQEGGRVARLKERHGFPATHSAEYLGAKNDHTFTYQASRDIAALLDSMKINLNLAPVVDVNINPDNPAIGRLARSFSSDPVTVGLHAASFIDGQRAEGVLSCIKHFPGHGSAFNDSHYGLTDISETWTDRELDPYRYLIEKDKVDMIMTGHLFHHGLDSEHPATLSQRTLSGLLREGLGYDGIIISDDMNMQAITDHYGLEEAVLLALQAGVDILLYANNMEYDPDIAEKLHNYIKKLVDEGKIARERIAESYERIMKLKARWYK